MANHFQSLFEKIKNWEETNFSALHVSGVTEDQWSFILDSALQQSSNIFQQKSQLIITKSNDNAEDFYESLSKEKYLFPVYFYPGLEAGPYSGILSSEKNFYDRFDILFKLLSHQKNNERFILVTSFEALCFKTPPKEFFLHSFFEIKKDDIISPHELITKLIYLGYVRSRSVEEPGTFVQKGQIFDLFPVGGPPVRLTYFDDLIEHISLIDLETQKTIKDSDLQSSIILPCAGLLTKDEFPVTLRENLPQFGPSLKNKFEYRKSLFNRLAENQLFENYPAYLPLFFKTPSTLLHYVDKKNTIISILNCDETHREFLDYKESLLQDFEREDQSPSSDCIFPHYSKIYDFYSFENLLNDKTICIDHLNLSMNEGNIENSIHLKIISTKQFLHQHVGPLINRPDFISNSLNFLKKYFEFDGHLIISSYSESSREEMRHLLSLQNFSDDFRSRIHFHDEKIGEGLFYENEKLLILTDGDLFASKKTKVTSNGKKNLDLFAEQLATLKKGDFIIHADYGIGIYLGLESLDIGGEKSDFLIIKYSDDDKIYLPVYKLNLIQKHADHEAGLKTDSLRTNKFQALKARARSSVKTLAFDLLKLQADRQLSTAFQFSEPDHLYREFELAFPFQETPDQESAINDVLKAMQKSIPMDHLVCGDVGFGKTEVAMRAAFKAIEDKKQVAVLVPTTILALQHFNSFSKRFNDFPVRIQFISRFKSPKECKLILEQAEKGEVDILIGTHKLLSEKLKFQDLGLVIVDEEQRFGVGHKEKLKLLKSSVDFLTLTATPIPRTLQMAFLGLRDLSLIKTAPPKRQSIKTYVIKEDDLTIQSALEKELKRGGQIFVVHNRVQDIEQYTNYIKELVPEASITFAHGQMSEKELEDRINAFYNGKFQILVATTIIESGIDIPNANTMIIDRADTYGLAQLHQLRGRIGRSDKKAYAYFIVPNGRDISTIATKRLQALQTYADMGAGFNIASVDLEIRGAGDILGASQSGHIEAVGLELYMELLKEAIREIKGEKTILKKDIEIITPFTSFIPNHYIADSSERLKQYKRLSNCESFENLESIHNELENIYGHFPEEVKNLFIILEARIHLQTLGLKSLQIVGSSMTLKFDKKFLDENQTLRDKVIQFFISRPKIYQFTPDYRVIYSHKTIISQTDLIRISKDLALNF